jgi:hypothetical protein
MTISDNQFASDILEMEDDLEQINRAYYMRGWTDGLPIIPPTEARVRRMLEGTTRAAQEVLGRIPPRWGEVTVEKVAINAVMAGCLPAYMPVLITAIEAMLEPQFNLYGIQATTHPVAPLLILNGPLAQALEVNSGYNAYGPGWRANATIGRAIRLILLNIGGGIPGKGDRSTQGSPGKYSYCIAENEARNPWTPLHVERGFPPDTSTVTVWGGEGPHNINDHVSQSAANLLTTVADTAATMGMNNLYLNDTEMLIALGPEHAATIAADGWSKEDVQKFLFEQARVPLKRAKHGGMWGMQHWPRWLDGRDEDSGIPIVQRWEDIVVIVTGGAGKHSSCVPTFGATRSVTRAVPEHDFRL